MQKKPNRLLETRKRLGLKQREIAGMLNVSPNYIYLVESGRKPMTTQLELLLDGLEPPSEKPNSTATAGSKMVSMINEAPSENKGTPPDSRLPWHCASCAKKDLEIDQLKRIVENLSSALATKHN